VQDRRAFSLPKLRALASPCGWSLSVGDLESPYSAVVLLLGGLWQEGSFISLTVCVIGPDSITILPVLPESVSRGLLPHPHRASWGFLVLLATQGGRWRQFGYLGVVGSEKGESVPY